MVDVRLEITEGAQRNLSNMERRVADIGQQYGERSAEYVEALRSLNQSLFNLLRLGGRVGPEDELSLISAGPFTFGIIAHAKHKDGEKDPLLVEWLTHS